MEFSIGEAWIKRDIGCLRIWEFGRRFATVLTGELCKRAAFREYDIHWGTLKKILEHDGPPDYRQSQPRAKPKIEPFFADHSRDPRSESQDDMEADSQRSFVPLLRPPCESQVDFGFADVILDGGLRRWRCLL